MLRAFALYFQLANIAEQHHRAAPPPRLRARGADAAASRSPTRSSAAAACRPTSCGAARRRLGRARPHRAPDRGDAPHAPARAPSHRRAAARARRPELPPSRERAQLAAQLAEEITILWQTDEVRSQRPRVVDEIRHGALVLRGEPVGRGAAAARASCREPAPGAPAAALASAPGSAATSTATRTRARETIEAALEQARDARARAAARTTCASSRALVGDRRPTLVERRPGRSARVDATCPAGSRTPTSPTAGS